MVLLFDYNEGKIEVFFNENTVFKWNLKLILWVYIFHRSLYLAKIHKNSSVSISRPLALALAPNLYLPALASNLYLPDLAPVLCLPVLAPNLYLLALVYNNITSPGPEFCICRPCLLNLCLYLRPWPTICINGLGPEFAFTLLLVVAVVVVIVVAVIPLK